jgi:hypothetical protein
LIWLSTFSLASFSAAAIFLAIFCSMPCLTVIFCRAWARLVSMSPNSRLSVDAACGQARAQDVVHLLELELGRRGLVDDIAVALELGVHALEVEAGGQFAVGLVDGVGQLVGVDFGHDVEGRHGDFLAGGLCRLYPSTLQKPGVAGRSSGAAAVGHRQQITLRLLHADQAMCACSPAWADADAGPSVAPADGRLDQRFFTAISLSKASTVQHGDSRSRLCRGSARRRQRQRVDATMTSATRVPSSVRAQASAASVSFSVGATSCSSASVSFCAQVRRRSC